MDVDMLFISYQKPEAFSSLKVYIMAFHLALDPREAAGTRLRVTEYPAVTTTVFPGHADGPQFVFLFNINLLHAGGTKQSPTLFSGQRLQEEVLVHLRVVQIDVVVRDVLCRQRVSLLRLHCAVLCQLGTENIKLFEKISATKMTPLAHLQGKKHILPSKDRQIKTDFF